MQRAMSAAHPIILYDGVCGLCDRFTQFVLKRDKHDFFRFASLQGEFAAQILRGYGVNPQQLDTVYVVVNFQKPNQELLSRSDAAIFVLQQLGGIWQAAATGLRTLPRPLRDAAYNFVARNHYRWFGKYESCLVPDPRQRHKFLDSH